MYTLLASNASWGMFGAGVLLLILLLVRRSRRYLGKTKREQSPDRQTRSAARQATPLIDAPPEILRWQVEMHETARELKAELDSKMSALQAITRIAREESARLEAAIARAERLGITGCADTLSAIEGLHGSDDSDGRVLPESSSTTAEEITARRDTVYQLADQGFAANAIARSIGVPLGEVELLISLRTNDASQNIS